MDIIYLIDATGSMGAEINIAKEYDIDIFKQLIKIYKDYYFRFGSVFYRDKVHQLSDKDEYYQFTNKMEELKQKLEKVRPYGGGEDGQEDWAGGYEIALKNLEWRNGIKLIIHIADAGAHGTEFSKGDQHPEQGKILCSLIEDCVKKISILLDLKLI